MRDQMKARHDITDRYLDKLSAADKKAMQDDIKANREKSQSAIRALLKPEQQKKFDDMEKERAARKAEWQEFQTWKAEKAKKAQ